MHKSGFKKNLTRVYEIAINYFVRGKEHPALSIIKPLPPFSGVKMNHNRFFCNCTLVLLFGFLITHSLNVLADNTWSYHQQSDSLTNRTYSFAQSPLPRPGLYDDMMLEIVCKDNKLQAVIDTDDLIASQGSRFNMEYQIDKKTPVTMQMKTFPDSKRKGYSYEFAKSMADDLLTGQAVFIRVNTMLRTVLSSSIALDNIAEPIKQVFADCGLGVASNVDSEPAYNLTGFEQDFSKLSEVQQQQVLAKIKKIMMEIK